MSTSRDAEALTPDQQELEYPNWWSRARIFLYLRSAHLDTTWNCFICVCVLVAVVWVIMELTDPITNAFDLGYNIVYGIHVASIVYSRAIHLDSYDLSLAALFRLVLDVVSFLHYAMKIGEAKNFKIFCYYLRFNKPLKYMWSLNQNKLQASVLGVAAKYCYLFFMLRITWALIWLYIFEKEHHEFGVAYQFLNALYIVNTMFIPIGPSEIPTTDIKRIIFMLVNLTGCLVVAGVAVASLSLVFSIYLQPEEAFRQRYRLIIKEMNASKVPPSLSDKVETFYKMYWHKRRAVSATKLLPTFPPTLPNVIYTDIYFEATQKNRVLRDLSYEFLSKVATKMDTVLYIPGDTIIKRNSKKSNMIFIAYGDIEMLTAEDDSTAILRMTCGTALSACAGGVPSACARAYVDIRAATFCITHVISVRDLWLLTLKHEHLKKVKIHYLLKRPEEAKYKSSIYHFKRQIMSLKETTDERGNAILGRKDVFLEIAGSYIMRKRADASQTNESDAICLRPTFPCILQPISSLQLVWHSFISCIIIVVCFTHPYYLVFKKTVPVEFRFFDYLVTVLFVLDLVVHLSTGENVEAGVPITFTQTASQQMRSRWFMLDVVGTLPIFEFISNGHFAGINKLLRLPKAFKMLKTLEEMCVYHGSVVRYLYYTLVLLIACYLIAALQQGFMCFQFRHCLVSNFTHTPFWENKTLDEETVNNRLLFGLYWAISMITFTTHKQTWVENNWNNTLYTLSVLELCIVLRIFIEAAYSANIMVTTALREDYDACIANVKNFLVRNSVDPQLRQRFIAYLQLCWFADKAFTMTNQKPSIFYDLPPHVYQDIVVRQRSKYLLSIPFIKLLNQEDLKSVSSQVKLFYTSPNEVLLNTGDISNEMYVIKQGMCEILDPDTKEVVGTLGIKDHFGAVECLLRVPAYYTVRAVTHLQTFSISNKVLSKAMELPKIKDAIEFAKERPEYSRLLKARESFQSYIPPAPAPNTERFRRPRKYETDYAYLQPFYRLGSFSILRSDSEYASSTEEVVPVVVPTPRKKKATPSSSTVPATTAAAAAAPKAPKPSKRKITNAAVANAQALSTPPSPRYIFPRFTIRPDGSYLMRYEWARATCALLSALLIPSYSYLVLQWPALYAATLLLDYCAYFDILQRMLVGYFNEAGALVYHPASTAAHYLKGAFIVDLFACLPLENLDKDWVSMEVDSDVVTIQYSSIKPFLMLNRLVQLYRLPGAMVSLQCFIERRDILLVIKAMPLFLVLLNTMAALMVYNSVTIQTAGNTWFIEPLGDEGGSWLLLFGNTCATVLTYYAVRIISVRANVNKELAAYQEHLKDIEAYMRNEDLPEHLQKEVVEYYEYNWDKTGGIDYTNVLKLCDQITLRTDAILHIYGPTFGKCPFLAECDVSLLRIIGRAVRSVYFLRGMLLVDKDDVIKDLYIVDDGVVAVKEHKDSPDSVAVLSKGSVFGNLEKTPTVRYSSAIVAESMVHVLGINASTFRRIICDFPQVAKDMKELRSEDENFIMGTAVDDDASMRGNTNSQLFFRQYRKRKSSHFFYERNFFQRYLMVISLICVYADVYNAGFQYNTFSFITFLYVLDACFYMKILLYCVFPYLIKSAHTKKRLNATKREYLKNEFKYDIMSCLPIELMCLVSENRQWTVFSWLRLNRMFRIVTAYKCLVRNQELITSNLTLSTVFTVLIWFTLFTHVTSCLWHFIGMLEDIVKPKSSWIYKDSGESWCQNLYICSLYFVLTTFLQTGVGDILPKNHSEVIFVCILQIVSTMLCMIYVGYFSNLIQFWSFRSFRFYSKYLELQEFLKNNRVSKNLVRIVNNYSLHLWRETRGMQVPHFLQVAPQSLRLRVMAAAYMDHLVKNPVFKNCEPAFLRQLVGCLQLYTYDEGLYVVRKTEITDSMYMIHSGRVKEISPTRRIYSVFKCFGVEQGLFHDLPYPYSYITVTKSQVLTLKLGDWEDLLKHFPDCTRKIYKYFNGSYDDFPHTPAAHTKPEETDINKDPDKATDITKLFGEPGGIIVLQESNTTFFKSNVMNTPIEEVPSTPDLDISRQKAHLAINTTLISETDSNNLTSEDIIKNDKPIQEGKQNLTISLSHESVHTYFSLPPTYSDHLKEELDTKLKQMSDTYNSKESYEMTVIDAAVKQPLKIEEIEAKPTTTTTRIEDSEKSDKTTNETASSDSKMLAIEYIPEVDMNPEKQHSTVTIKEISEDNPYALVPYNSNREKHSSQESRLTKIDSLKTQSMPSLRIRDSGNDITITEVTSPEDQAGPSTGESSKKNKEDKPNTT